MSDSSLMLKEAQMSDYWYRFNFNKYKKNLPDCAIRAVVAAIGMDYDQVCKKLGVAFKKGHGLIRDTGIDLNDLFKTFDEYLGKVEDVDFDNDWTNRPEEFDDFIDPFDDEQAEIQAMTVEDFCELYNGQGKFLVGTKSSKDPNAPEEARREGGHIVCVTALPGKKPYFVDTWDSGKMVVDAWALVKKHVPAASPLHWKYDKAAKRFV